MVERSEATPSNLLMGAIHEPTILYLETKCACPSKILQASRVLRPYRSNMLLLPDSQLLIVTMIVTTTMLLDLTLGSFCLYKYMDSGAPVLSGGLWETSGPTVLVKTKLLPDRNP